MDEIERLFNVLQSLMANQRGINRVKDRPCFNAKCSL